MTASHSQGEIRPLTGLRGVAALAVVCHHLATQGSLSAPLRTVTGNFYLAVDLFFVLSGFVIAMTYGAGFDRRFSLPTYVDYLRRRFARTYPLYLFCTATTFVLVLNGLMIPWDVARPGLALLPNLLLLQAWHNAYGCLDAPGWSISTEWGAYLLFPLLCWIILFSRRVVCVIGCGAAIAALIMLTMDYRGKMGPLDVSSGLTFGPGLRCLAGFTLGIAAYRVSTCAAVTRIAASGAAPASVAAAIVALLFVQGADLLIVLLMPLLIIGLSASRAPVAALLAAPGPHYLGVISYSIYLVHVPIMLTLERSLKLVGLPDHGYLVVAGTLALLLPVASLTYALIEQPGRRLLRRRPARAALSPVYQTGDAVASGD